MSENVLEYLNKSLDRIVPISDPDYIIGENDSLHAFDTWVRSCVSGKEGFLGTVVLGQIGNGKTHFLRFVRRHYSNELIGIYIPNMFIGGPLLNALNDIYKSFFLGLGNYSLKHYLPEWEAFMKTNTLEQVEGYQNNIFRYLLRCNNKEEQELVLDYFSNKEMFPDQLKFLKTKFGSRKNFINNENDFATITGEAFEFMQTITGKSLLLLFDEVDKVYSSEKNSPCLTRVGLKILSSYRALFDYLNAKQLTGIICVGATPEAWDVLSRQTAFERRFKDRKVILKVPKSKDDCFAFSLKRLEEINYKPNDKDKEKIAELINNLSDERLKTWADVITALRAGQKSQPVVNVGDDPVEIILEILINSILPLTWNEIIAKSVVLRKMYPKTQPTTLLSKLEKEGKIKSIKSHPKTYESVFHREGLF